MKIPWTMYPINPNYQDIYPLPCLSKKFKVLLPIEVSKQLLDEWQASDAAEYAAFYGVWSGSILFAQACLSHYSR